MSANSHSIMKMKIISSVSMF